MHMGPAGLVSHAPSAMQTLRESIFGFGGTGNGGRGSLQHPPALYAAFGGGGGGNGSGSSGDSVDFGDASASSFHHHHHHRLHEGNYGAAASMLHETPSSVAHRPHHAAPAPGPQLPTNETRELTARTVAGHGLLQSLYEASDHSVQHRRQNAHSARSVHQQHQRAPGGGGGNGSGAGGW